MADAKIENKAKKDRFRTVFSLFLSLFCIAAAVLLFRRAGEEEIAYRRVLENAIGVLLLFASLLLFYFMWLTRDSEPNFFLYDKRLGKNIPLEKLTFDVVNAKMNFYVNLIARSEGDLWQGDVLFQQDKFGYHGIFKPLVVYKMLYDLAALNCDEVSNWFFSADDAVFRIVCDTLSKTKDSDLADRLVSYRQSGSAEKLVRFLDGNRKYVQHKMVNFVVRNVNLFY